MERRGCEKSEKATEVPKVKGIERRYIIITVNIHVSSCIFTNLFSHWFARS